MTRPTVSSRIVGTPDDRKSALSVVMSGIRKPNPTTLPAASMAWTTMMSGSIAPVIASDQRSNDRKLVQRLTWIGLLVAWLHYDLTFSFDWPVLILSSVLVTTMATAVGYAIAVTLPAMLAQLASQVLVFFVLLFSPITFPADQLPDWFQSLHALLPVQPAADLMRAGIASGTFSADGRDLLVLTIWTLVGLLVTTRALVRRR